MALLFLAATAQAAPGGALLSSFSSDGQQITVRVDPDGHYQVDSPSTRWSFEGTLGQIPQDLQTRDGADAVGAYQEITFRYHVSGERAASIRVYRQQPAVLFSLRFVEAARNEQPFPAFSTHPAEVKQLSFRGLWAAPQFGQLAAESPWLFYDNDGRALLLSPASRFMITGLRQQEGTWQSSVSPRIDALPAGFAYETLLVIGKSINSVFDQWGQVLTSLHNKRRPGNDAEVTLRKLGYWTDLGAAYYYHMEPGLSYENTLLSVRDAFAAEQIGLGYLQLDSWFYPKGPEQDWSNGRRGIYRYRADSTLFPDGLSGFQQKLGLPLVTHARWIDEESPLRREYQVSGNVAVDPLYWEDTAAYLSKAGVVVYEQDWLGAGAWTDMTVTAPDAYLDRMAESMARRGIQMQYCMALAHHYLQTVKYPNLTTIRTSDDRFGPTRYDHFLYASRIASALGVWPWSDVFRSGERDNFVLSLLSGGVVGISDQLGTFDWANIRRAVRADGVLVKPDTAAVPLDAMYLRDAAGLTQPMLAAAFTSFGDLRAAYLFAYPRRPEDRHIKFTGAELHLDGTLYVHNAYTGEGRLLSPGDAFEAEIPEKEGQLYVVAPLGPSRIAFLGDKQQWISWGRNRIAYLEDHGTLQATVTFAKGESSRTLHGYSEGRPIMKAAHGGAASLVYDSKTGEFTVAVMPGSDGIAVINMESTPRRRPVHEE